MSNSNANQNRLSGRYEIIEQIGIGGMSYVYKAYDSKRRKIVAIKVLKDELSLDPEFVAKFKSEALSCKDIRHENVISAYDVVDEGKMHYIVMEYIEGTTLNKYIKDKGKLSNEEVVKLSIQVAKGIQAAHKKGIIHRDIKPQNIVIDDKKVAKITDFGIARAITSTTRNISVVGTVHYISPEQVRNTTVDFRSDIYSFGCTIYEMITGVVPFKGDTPLEIIISHLRENIKAPHLDNPHIYKSLEKIIIKATRMIPRERYQGIEEMIADLEKALADKEGTYINSSVYDDDEEGKTVIINDEDMKVIKQVSSKFASTSSYSKKTDELTPEQKEFFDRYIKNGAFKQHMFMRKLIIAAIACVAILAIATIIITLDTRKQARSLATRKDATASEVFVNLKESLEGIDFELAKSLATDYGLIFNVIGEEYSDTIGFGKIIRIEKDNSDVDKTLDIVLSKGGVILDFTNKEELQNTKWSDMLIRLNERGLKYSVSEISDQIVPRGYIIGVNKNTSDQSGQLVFTVSKGLSEQVKIMPDFYDKPIAEVRELLETNELVLGDISFKRDYVVKENCVINQSVEKGTEVKSGTRIDLTLSCGPDGVEYIAEKKEKWYGELSATYRVVKDNTVNVASGDSMILQVRLVQNTSEGIIYTELIEPQEYKYGTVLPLVFTSIEGEPKVQKGQVQVVDVVNDAVVSSIDVIFWPKNG